METSNDMKIMNSDAKLPGFALFSYNAK